MFDGYNIKPTIFIDLKVKSRCCYKCFIAKTNLKKMFVSGPRPDNFFFQNVPAVTKTFFYLARVLFTFSFLRFSVLLELSCLHQFFLLITYKYLCKYPGSLSDDFYAYAGNDCLSTSEVAIKRCSVNFKHQ